jgi:hypothetical protein
MPGRLGLTWDEARSLIGRSAKKVVEAPKELRDEALSIVEDAFRDMYVSSDAGEEQTRDGVEALMTSVRLLVAEMDAAGASGGGRA